MMIKSSLAEVGHSATENLQKYSRKNATLFFRI